MTASGTHAQSIVTNKTANPDERLSDNEDFHFRDVRRTALVPTTHPYQRMTSSKGDIQFKSQGPRTSK